MSTSPPGHLRGKSATRAGTAPARRAPRIGQPVRGSSTGRPVMVVLDLLGRRSTLRILWELREATLNFRALQEACETNSSLLNTRLKELRELGLVELGEAGYALSGEGRRLSEALAPLTAWARSWGASRAAAAASGRASRRS